MFRCDWLPFRGVTSHPFFQINYRVTSLSLLTRKVFFWLIYDFPANPLFLSLILLRLFLTCSEPFLWFCPWNCITGIITTVVDITSTFRWTVTSCGANLWWTRSSCEKNTKMKKQFNWVFPGEFISDLQKASLCCASMFVRSTAHFRSA